MLAAFVVALSVAVAFLYFTQDSPGEDDLSSIKERVSRHYLLPTDEEPALLTVTDPSKLSTDFLRHTKAGDKVLVYQSSRKAVIYRPSIDRIVDVAPVIIDTPKNPKNE